MTQRIHSLDLLRLVAVLFVVSHHAAVFLPEPVLRAPAFVVLDGMTRWSVPALFLISGYLAGWRNASGSMATGLSRIKRLVLPYACWGVLYTLIFGVQARAQGLPVHLPDVTDALTGQGVYFILWFLPMLAYCTLLSEAFGDERGCLAGAIVSLTGWFALATTIFENRAALAYSASPAGFLLHLPFFFGCYLLAKWLGLRNATHRLPSLGLLTSVTAACLILKSGWGLTNPAPDDALSRSLGLTLVAATAMTLLLIALHFPTAGSRLSTFWSTAAPLGIYLTHMIVLEVLVRLFPADSLVWYLSWSYLTGGGFVGAAIIVRGMVWVPLLRPSLGLASSWSQTTASAFRG